MSQPGSNAQNNYEQMTNPATAFNDVVQSNPRENVRIPLPDGSLEITDPAVIAEIAERVYQLLLKDARIDRERQGY
jgi:hypothetical protein